MGRHGLPVSARRAAVKRRSLIKEVVIHPQACPAEYKGEPSKRNKTGNTVAVQSGHIQPGLPLPCILPQSKTITSSLLAAISAPFESRTTTSVP